MSILLSPLMNLPIPSVGAENGPQYATDVNNSFTILDGHNHSPGSGNQITPAGLNINSNLPINLNFLTQVAGVTFAPQTVVPANITAYAAGDDLFFVDGLGNNIQITASGGIAGTPGSIANLTSPASATYVAASSTFVWQSNTNIAANMDFGSALMRNLSPNSTFALTLSPPSNLTTNYTLTLPSLPTGLSFMTLDASGNITAPYSTSGGLNATVLTPNSITATQLANAIITGTQVANNINLPGDAVQEDGKNVVVSSTNANTSLAIIRGVVSASGSILFGEGFSVIISGGTFVIDFDIPFASVPVVVASILDANLAFITTSSPATGNVRISCFNSAGAPIGDNFSFIAIGPR